MAGIWQGLINQPSFETGTMILLTDGRIMVNENDTKHWHALKPDSRGSYINGAWGVLSDMHYSRLYYASGVLKDGRVVVCGGEYSDAGNDTNTCEIYDPVLNTWKDIPSPPAWALVGDASCCVLPDGRFMIGALTNKSCTIYDPEINSWSIAASKTVRSNEETWILLPDSTIITAQCFPPYKSEKYIIASNTWQDEGAIPVPLVNPNMAEIGPAMLLYNGKVIYFGAEKSGGFGKTAIYTLPGTPTDVGTWEAGPNIPKVAGTTMVCNDCPATLLPNGKVLFTAANYQANNWGSPILFFEYDPDTNTIIQAPTPSNNGSVLYTSRLMLLPTGQVLFSPSSNNMQCYTPDGSPQAAWKPVVTSVASHQLGTTSTIDYYILKGTLLNGWSQANTYGDDCYASTNYPLIRLHNTCSDKMYYARSFNFSTMGVATGSSEECCNFSTENIPDGEYELTVIANGISSIPIAIQLPMTLDKECCSCSEIGINLEPVCEDCVAPPAPPWADCDNCMKWFIPVVITKEIVDLKKEQRLVIQVEITQEIDLCLKGRQQGKLLFTTSLLPKEELKIYHYDRYRQVTSAEQRMSVHTSFRQSVSAIWQSRTTADFSNYSKTISSVRAGADTSGSLLGFLVGSAGVSGSTSNETSTNLRVTADVFNQVASSASFMVEAERSLSISHYEDKEQVDITSRTLRNMNDCRAVNYYIRRVNEVYELVIKVSSIRFKIIDKQFSQTGWMDVSQVDSLADNYKNIVIGILQGQPKVGDTIKDLPCISIPSDGTMIEAELAHCGSCDPEREAALMIALEQAKNASRKVCLEAELIALEVERRKALITKGDLSPFEQLQTATP